MPRPGFTLVVPFFLIQALFAQVDAGQPAPPASGGVLNVVIVEGDGAINNVRQRTAREAIVEVDDENHKPIGGALVTFTLPSSGPTGTFANGSRILTLVTDSKGQAVMRGLHAAKASGSMPIKVSASFQGHTATATIAQTNAIGAAAGAGGGTAAAGGLLSAKVIAIIAVIGATAGTTIGLVAANSGGGGGSPARMPTVLTPGAPVIGPPR
ncbi:MAG: hypothetical protein M3Y07_15660 [Acidobacteriota bacterium]|nr:hypothetical protein [Acidobacteriota bacterium]